MSTLNVNIYGREYQLACDDGQEAHLGKLAQDLNDRVRKLGQRMGRGQEGLMLVITAIMMLDELHDAKQEIAELRREMERLESGEGDLVMESQRLQEMEEAVASTVDTITERVEKLSLKLAKAA